MTCLVKVTDLPAAANKLPGRLDVIKLVKGDLTVAALLSQIIFWYAPDKQGHQKQWGAVCKIDGLRYIWNTRAQWMTQTGLTLDRYKRALSVLKARDFVEVRIWRDDRQVPITHIRLKIEVVQAAFVQLLASTPVEQAPVLEPVGHPPILRLVASPPVLSSENTFRDIPSETTALLPSASDQHNEEGEIEGRGETGGIDSTNRAKRAKKRRSSPTDELERQSLEESQAMTAKEILARHQAAHAGKALPTSLGALWVQQHHLSVGKLPPLTVKDQGMLKQVAKRIGIEETRCAIGYVLTHWKGFSQQAQIDAGAPIIEMPQVWYFVKYCGVALSLLAHPETIRKKTTPAAVVPVTPDLPAEPVATYAEIDAILKALDVDET